MERYHNISRCATSRTKERDSALPPSHVDLIVSKSGGCVPEERCEEDEGDDGVVDVVICLEVWNYCLNRDLAMFDVWVRLQLTPYAASFAPIITRP